MMLMCSVVAHRPKLDFLAALCTGMRLGRSFCMYLTPSYVPSLSVI